MNYLYTIELVYYIFEVIIIIPKLVSQYILCTKISFLIVIFNFLYILYFF